MELADFYWCDRRATGRRGPPQACGFREETENSESAAASRRPPKACCCRGRNRKLGAGDGVESAAGVLLGIKQKTRDRQPGPASAAGVLLLMCGDSPAENRESHHRNQIAAWVEYVSDDSFAVTRKAGFGFFKESESERRMVIDFTSHDLGV